MWTNCFIFGIKEHMSLKRKSILFFLIVFLIGSGFFGGYLLGKNNVVCQVCPPEDVNFSLFWRTWKTLQEKYVDKTKLDVQAMIYGAISGMVDSLNDPYTIFMKPDNAKRFVEDVKGSFEGVGMEVGIKNGRIQVIAPLENTPAQKAGLRAGDIILRIDGTSTEGFTVEETVNLIRGPKGKEVKLGIYREEWGKEKEISIIRDVISVPSLKLEIKDGNIGYIKLYQFSEKASSDFGKAVGQILEKGSQKIIIDLRDNPGGYLEVAQDIAGWFLERGQVVVIEDFGPGKENNEYKAQGNSRLLPFSVVILINEGSASASEILAGALRDNRNIKLIGQTSFGKGSVQQLESLGGGSSLKVTVAKWLTPKGYSISEKGLEPDIKVDMTDEDFLQNRDPQLDKAIEIIKGL